MRNTLGTQAGFSSLRETPPPTFILSTGRSGSAMLARALGQHPSLLCLHEPKPNLNAESLAHWCDSHPEEKIRSNIALKRDSLVLQTHAQHFVYVESSYFLTHLIPFLDDLYEARFIHLHRDGRRFVRSAIEQPWYVTDREPMRALKRLFRRYFLVDVGVSSEDHRLPTPEGYESRFEKISWLCRKINEVIARELDALPGERSTRIALRKLNEPAGFRRIVEFLGGEADNQLIDEMVSVARDKPNKNDADRELPPVEDWSHSRLQKFKSIAGGMMRELGYSSQ